MRRFGRKCVCNRPTTMCLSPTFILSDSYASDNSKYISVLPEKIKMRKCIRVNTYELVIVAAITSKASSAIKEPAGLRCNGCVPLHLEEMDRALALGGMFFFARRRDNEV